MKVCQRAKLFGFIGILAFSIVLVHSTSWADDESVLFYIVNHRQIG